MYRDPIMHAGLHAQSHPAILGSPCPKPQLSSITQAHQASLRRSSASWHWLTAAQAAGNLTLTCSLQSSSVQRPPSCLFIRPHTRACPQDMTTLAYLNEPGVLFNLKSRYILDSIYTYTGSILIAVNPFAHLPHLYGEHMMEQYRGRNLGELQPHVFAIADSAFRQMQKEKRSQSILVRAVE